MVFFMEGAERGDSVAVLLLCGESWRTEDAHDRGNVVGVVLETGA